MKIFIYVTGQSEDLVAELINRLDKTGISFFIDEKTPSKSWKVTIQDNCKVFNNDYECYSEDYPAEFTPFILCSSDYNEDPDWDLIQSQLKGDCTGSIQTPPIQKNPKKRPAENVLIEPKTKTPKDTEHYDLETYYDKNHDTMFYQMTRPNENYTWTSVTIEYSKREHLPFFSSFFYLSSFGKPSDIDFLDYCWNKFGMEGRMEVDYLVENHINLAKEEDKYSPRVYLNNIKMLICLFNKNYWP